MEKFHGLDFQVVGNACFNFNLHVTFYHRFTFCQHVLTYYAISTIFHHFFKSIVKVCTITF